jgi:O-antigen ligase
MVFAIITYWHDFLTPFFYVPAGTPFSNPGRGAGLFINANQAGTALVVMGIIAMPFVSKRWHALILLVVLLGVVPTFSRSAILFALIAAGVWIWHERSQRWNVVFILVGLPLIISLGVQLFDIGIASREINTSNVTDRVAFFTNFGGAADSSADERQYVAALSWQKFTEHPLTGLGVGVTDALSNDWGYHQSTHNMFLRLMVEQGILGGAMYLVFLMLIFARGRGLIKNASTAVEKNIGIALILMALNFTFIGLFSHTLLQEPSTIISLALLLAAAHRVEAGSLRNGHGPMHAHIPTLRG